MASDLKAYKYPAKQHARRVAAKLGVKRGLIYLPGEKTRLLVDSDMDAPFRQLRYFYYMTGVDRPDCFVTYDIAKDVLVLYITLVKPQQAIWFGKGLSPDEAQKLYDADSVKPSESLQSDLRSWTSSHFGSSVYLLHPSQEPKLGVNLTNGDLLFDTTALQPAINACRVIKDDHEINLLRQANSVACDAHTAILRHLRHMTNERDVQALFQDICTSAGSSSLSYGTIAGSGPNAAVLHYMKNDEDFGDRELLLIDAGPDWHCYASDVTRTFPISGSWRTDEAKAIYDLVNEMQSQVIQRLKPGVRYIEMQNLATEIAIKGLLKLGIFRAEHSVKDIIRSGASKIFFPHGLGHHIGLEVHDVSAAPINGLATGPPEHERFTAVPRLSMMEGVVLEKNMVITVEPGLYFSAIALEQLVDDKTGKYINLDVARHYLRVGGVRIEDDVLITEDGYENITTTPKGEAAFKIIRGEA